MTDRTVWKHDVTRLCARCEEAKPPGAYGPKVVGDWHGLDSYCRECRAAMMRERRAKERETQ